ncbi:MAG: type II toxin-antitoxin system RelE/ParE family toxin [Deltaproteobacteria bacterium]|nr:type II toxin-antitoxin system RelE/ParE family toxin [Deltaproteobacteria bacterium]
MKAEFHPVAATEVVEAGRTYAKIDRKLGSRFEAQIQRAIERIEAAPERWPAHLHGTRRVLLQRFPYAVIYRYEPEL